MSSEDRPAVGDRVEDLDARLDAELSAYNLATSGVPARTEFTVRTDDDAGELVAGLDRLRPRARQRRARALRSAP